MIIPEYKVPQTPVYGEQPSPTSGLRLQPYWGITYEIKNSVGTSQYPKLTWTGGVIRELLSNTIYEVGNVAVPMEVLTVGGAPLVYPLKDEDIYLNVMDDVASSTVNNGKKTTAVFSIKIARVINGRPYQLHSSVLDIYKPEYPFALRVVNNNLQYKGGSFKWDGNTYTPRSGWNSVAGGTTVEESRIVMDLFFTCRGTEIPGGRSFEKMEVYWENTKTSQPAESRYMLVGVSDTGDLLDTPKFPDLACYRFVLGSAKLNAQDQVVITSQSPVGSICLSPTINQTWMPAP